MNYIFIEAFGNGGVGFEVLLTSHCNLKCRGCMRYSNIAKQEFYRHSNRGKVHFHRW